MPEMGGCEAVRLFRAFEEKELAEGRRSRRQLIIGMSANSDANVTQEALGKLALVSRLVHLFLYHCF